MRKEIIVPTEWLINFKKSVSKLIAEHKLDGYNVKSLIMTENLLARLYEAQGYESIDFLGYKLEVAEVGEDIDEDAEIVFIDGDPIN